MLTGRSGSFVRRRPQLALRIDLGGMFLQRFLVDVDAEAGSRRQFDVTVLRLQLVRRNLVAEVDEGRKYSVMMKFGMVADACTVEASATSVEL